MLTIQDIENMDLSFIKNDSSREFLTDMLNALITTQKYIDVEYNKMWTNIDTIPDNIFIEVLDSMNGGFNVFEYFKNIENITFANSKCLDMINNNMKHYDNHTGFTYGWTVKNIQSMLCGFEAFKTAWLSKN